MVAHAKYKEWLDPDKLMLIQGWARDGLTEVDIAKNMGISTRQLTRWKTDPRCEAINIALKKGKEVVDIAVENALLKQALSGNVTAQIYWLQNRAPDKWKDRRREHVTNESLSQVKDVLVKIKEVAEDGHRNN